MVTVLKDVMRYLHAVTARVRDVFGDRTVGVLAFLLEVLQRLRAQLRPPNSAEQTRPASGSQPRKLL